MKSLDFFYPPLAVAAVEEFLEDENWQMMAKQYGWVIQKLDPITLIVVLKARILDGLKDTFTLRLTCETCPAMPPDVRFVNPDTLDYDFTTDKKYVAKLTSPSCTTHLSYSYNPPYKYGPQLVCTSMSYGYYVSNHSPTVEQKWEPLRHSIGSSIEIVHRTLQSLQYYQGRFT
jgi:hypothetical protein